mmetsp:Transcript_8732/g.10189  ORF Transcript_8732/g.10189 Transcript_8732/m.10189 type:complete len:208 (-) Transcript_8732:171-794(-)
MVSSPNNRSIRPTCASMSKSSSSTGNGCNLINFCLIFSRTTSSTSSPPEFSASPVSSFAPPPPPPSSVGKRCIPSGGENGSKNVLRSELKARMPSRQSSTKIPNSSLFVSHGSNSERWSRASSLRRSSRSSWERSATMSGLFSVRLRRNLVWSLSGISGTSVDSSVTEAWTLVEILESLLRASPVSNDENHDIVHEQCYLMLCSSKV